MVVFELSVPCTRACIMHMGVAYKRVLSNMHCHRGDRRLKLFACVQVRMPRIVAATTIRGRRLFRSEVRRFCSYYSRATTILRRRLFEYGSYLMSSHFTFWLHACCHHGNLLTTTLCSITPPTVNCQCQPGSQNITQAKSTVMT